MSLDRIGAVVLPFLDAAIDEAVSYLTDFQLYVQAWRELLDV